MQDTQTDAAFAAKILELVTVETLSDWRIVAAIARNDTHQKWDVLLRHPAIAVREARQALIAERDLPNGQAQLATTPTETTTSECPFCDGSGEHPYTEGQCNACKGSGKLERPI